MSNRTGTADDKGRADKVKDRMGDATDQVKDKAANAAADVKDTGEHLVDEGREKARELSHKAGEKARTRADEEKDRVAGGMRTMAEALRKGSRELPAERDQYRPLLNKVADRIDSATGYLDSRDIDTLTHDARRFARDHTPLFLGGAFALGVLGARFLKSSSDNVRADEYGRMQGDYPGYPGSMGQQTDRYDRMLPESGTTGSGPTQGYSASTGQRSGVTPPSGNVGSRWDTSPRAAGPAGEALTDANSTGTRAMNASPATGAADQADSRTAAPRDASRDSRGSNA